MSPATDVPDDIGELVDAFGASSDVPVPARPRRESAQWHWLRVFTASAEPAALKRSGIVHATYADSDGTNITPSLVTVADQLGKHPKQVARDRRQLRDGEWMPLVGAHSMAVGVTDEYRLGVPWTSTVPTRTKPKLRARAAGAPVHTLSAEAEAEKSRARETRSTGWKSAWLRAVVRSPAYTDPEVLVATALAVEATGTGVEVHPGREELEAATGLSLSAVRTALAGLRESRAITKLFAGKLDGRGLHDEYILTDPDPAWLAARLQQRDETKARLSQARQDGAKKRRPRAEPGARHVPEPGAPDVPNQGHAMFQPGARHVPTRGTPCSEPGAPDVLTRGTPCTPTTLVDHAGTTTLDDRVEDATGTSANPPAAATTTKSGISDVDREHAAAVMGRYLGADWLPDLISDVVAVGTPAVDVTVIAYQLAKARGHVP